MTLVSNLNGTFTLDDLKRMTWPVAWSGTKDHDEADAEETALYEFARKAAAELQEYYDYAGNGEGDYAVRVVNGEVVEIVGV